MKRTIILLISLVFIFFCTTGIFKCNGGNGTPTPDPPVPPTPDPVTLTGITIDWSTLKKAAKGSDNFATTWASDGHQYTTWGDGWGFSESGGKTSLGVSRISGSYDLQTYTDLWRNGNGKSYGILGVNSALVMWVGEWGSYTDAWNRTRLYLSTDNGVTWAQCSWNYMKGHNLHTPTFLQAGKDYADAQDNYVYSYAPMLNNYDNDGIHKPGLILQFRCPKDKLLDWTAWEYFAADHWDADITKAVPITLPLGCQRIAVMYFKDLNKYVMSTQHSKGRQGNLTLYQSDTPWGPWSLFYHTTKFGKGHGGIAGKSFYWNFSAAWSEGKDFAMIFTGIGDDDRYMSLKGSFTTQ